MTENQMHLGVDCAKGKDLTSLLVIELESEGSVPKIFYKGHQVKHLVDVLFQWKTKTDEPGNMNFKIKHYEDTKDRKYLKSNTIEVKVIR